MPATGTPAAGTPAAGTPTAVEPPRWAGPSLEDRLQERLKGWLLGGNPLVRIGATLLVIGAGFLAVYLADRGFFPPALRLASIMAGGLVVLALGWKFRAREGAYGLVLQGAGIAILYLAIFAGLRLYDLIPALVAFPALVLIVAGASGLAVLQNALPLAIFATVGGFAAPILTSTGSGNYVALFGYYALLDVGILAVAWYRSWRLLNWFGFVFTFGVGAVWGLLDYRDAYYANAQAFLAFFFLLYVAIPVLYALRQPPQLRGLIDGSLVFGVPTIAFAMQAGLVHDMRFGVATSAVLVGGVYTAVATGLWRRVGEDFRLLAQAHIALAVTFVTLAIPFALDDQRITGAAWALEGAGLVWVGVRQQRRLPRAAGLALQVLAAGAVTLYSLLEGWRAADTLPYLNGHFIAVLLLGVGGLASAWFLEQTDGERSRGPIAWAALAWGGVWWLLAGVREADAAFPPPWPSPLAGIWVGGSMLLAGLAQPAWRGARELLIAGVPVLALLVLLTFDAGQARGVWTSAAAPGWLLALAACWLGLRRAERSGPGLLLAHVGVVQLVALLAAWASWDLAQAAGLSDRSWLWVPWGLAPALLAWALPTLTALGIPATAGTAWRREAPCVLGAWALLWSVLAVGLSGAVAPLTFVPVLNPLELSQLICLVTAAWMVVTHLRAQWAEGLAVVAAAAFLVVSVMVARAAHHLGGVPWDAGRLFDSGEVQTGLAVLWTLLAGAAMVGGHRLARRRLWMVGAALLGVVVLKLFVIDLAESSMLWRILSFLCVGALVLLVGYFAPLPPHPETDGDTPEDRAEEEVA